MEETWKDIVGYEGLYQVSNLGRVKSLPRKNVTKEKILIGGNNGDGYIKVSLSNKLHYVHRLVAEAFIPKIEGKNFVNHKDEVRSNNNVDNLEWCTNQENINFSVANLRHPNFFKTNTGHHHISKDDKYYRVHIKHVMKRFKKLEEAIAYRDKTIKEFYGKTEEQFRKRYGKSWL